MDSTLDALEALLGLAKTADADALNRLCKEIEVRLRPILEFRLRSWSREDREDLLQNTLITFCEKIGGVSDHPLRFALAILRNKVGNELQAARRQREVALVTDESAEDRAPSQASLAASSLAAAQDDMAANLERKERAEQIVAAIRQLADFCKQALFALLRGYSVMEVWQQAQSEEVGLKRGTFDKRLFDCKKRLKVLLGGIDHD